MSEPYTMDYWEALILLNTIDEIAITLTVNVLLDWMRRNKEMWVTVSQYVKDFSLNPERNDPKKNISATGLDIYEKSRADALEKAVNSIYSYYDLFDAELKLYPEQTQKACISDETSKTKKKQKTHNYIDLYFADKCNQQYKLKKLFQYRIPFANTDALVAPSKESIRDGFDALKEWGEEIVNMKISPEEDCKDNEIQVRKKAKKFVISFLSFLNAELHFRLLLYRQYAVLKDHPEISNDRMDEVLFAYYYRYYFDLGNETGIMNGVFFRKYADVLKIPAFYNYENSVNYLHFIRGWTQRILSEYGTMIQEKGLGTWTEEDYEHAYRFLTEYHIDEELLNPLIHDNTNMDEKELVQRIADIIENQTIHEAVLEANKRRRPETNAKHHEGT